MRKIYLHHDQRARDIRLSENENITIFAPDRIEATLSKLDNF